VTKPTKIQCNLCGEMVENTSYHLAKHRADDMEKEAEILATRLAKIDMALATMDPKFQAEFKAAMEKIDIDWKDTVDYAAGIVVEVLTSTLPVNTDAEVVKGDS
jgi:hypothetical protein